ncbi:alpha/beta fold hydrolase [Streptomyces sp. NPDC057539]|uniref:alpha/beta fold hydrolase n=1 Tax=Streptomyces sp. NPDC057539 TaxID=3346159 RepID=UPI0036D16F73
MDETAVTGDRDETVLTDDGVRLWATRTGGGATRTGGGAGEPVILCHGGPGLWDTLEEPAALLPDTPAYRWDQRGCGRSQRSGPYGTDRSVADLDGVRRHFGLDRVTLLGHSWGARLALAYALAHPARVSGLIYVAGTGIDADSTWHPAYKEAFLRRLGERRDHRERWEELRGLGDGRTDAQDREYAILQWSVDFTDRDRALAHAEAMATPWFGVNHTCNTTIGAELRRPEATRGLRERCAALRVPVLIVDGEDDIRPRWSVDSLESVLPDVTRTTLAGAGHLPWTEDPEGFRTAVGAFLGGVRRTGARRREDSR